MGLVQRLTADDDSPLARALRLRGRREPHDGDGGAHEGDHQADRPSSGAAARSNDDQPFDAGAAVRVLVRQLSATSGFGITTPSHLFSLLHTYLRVSCGALLVYSAEDEAFVPIASAGLDATSRVRMMITANELDAIGVGDRVAVVADAGLEVFRDRLSSEDFASFGRPAILPFVHLRARLAVLVIFGSPILDVDPAILDVVLGALGEHAGRLLFDGRERPLGKADAPAVFDAAARRATVRRRLDEAQRSSRTLECLRLDYTALLKAIENAHPHLDRTRLVHDILQTIALLVHRQWSVVAEDLGAVLLVGPKLPSSDPELITATLSTTLGELFGAGRSIPLGVDVIPADQLIA